MISGTWAGRWRTDACQSREERANCKTVTWPTSRPVPRGDLVPLATLEPPDPADGPAGAPAPVEPAAQAPPREDWRDPVDPDRARLAAHLAVRHRHGDHRSRHDRVDHDHHHDTPAHPRRHEGPQGPARVALRRAG